MTLLRRAKAGGGEVYAVMDALAESCLLSKHHKQAFSTGEALLQELRQS